MSNFWRGDIEGFLNAKFKYDFDWLDPILSSISYLTLFMVNQYSCDQKEEETYLEWKQCANGIPSKDSDH